MQKVLILGAGKIGALISGFLAECRDYEVHVADVNGNAVVVLSVPADTPTQTGIIRATDITTGNQVTGSFPILQMTVGGAVLSVLPLGSTTINGPDNRTCSSGVTVTNYIFGGTPPYQVAVNFPQTVTLGGVPVLTSGGAWSGERDLVVRLLDQLGWRKVYHRVKMGPGKAVGFGLLKDIPVFCLPGGPPSNQMAFLQLALPGLLRLGGHGRPGLARQRGGGRAEARPVRRSPQREGGRAKAGAPRSAGRLTAHPSTSLGVP